MLFPFDDMIPDIERLKTAPPGDDRREMYYALFYKYFDMQYITEDERRQRLTLLHYTYHHILAEAY